MVQLLATVSLLAATLAAAVPESDNWERLFHVRDTTDLWDGRPEDGWRVSAVHTIVLGNGKVLAAAWGRKDEFKCQGRAYIGTSFVLDPSQMVGKGEPAVLPAPALEEASVRWDDRHRDVVSFGGHTHGPDGRPFFFGGVRFDMRSRSRAEGLNYARVFNPETGTFERSDHPSPFGTGWYSTALALPDQRILVAAGFKNCCRGEESAALATFDWQRFVNGVSNPWQHMLGNKESRQDIVPENSDYTRLFLLPTPVMREGLLRQVVAFGKGAELAFFNTDVYLPAEQRFASSENPKRPGGCGRANTAALAATGEILVYGGCDVESNIDLYDPISDTWRRIDSGLTRNFAASVLLPDGTVLLINGENKVDQNTGEPFRDEGDPRTPQILDPFTGVVTTMDSEGIEPADNLDHETLGLFRGYHSTASLLHDGRILVGGGKHKEGRNGCEHANMRLFNPPYMQFAASRPRILSVDGPTSGDLPALFLDDHTSYLTVRFSSSAPLLGSSDAPGTRSGVVAMALSAQTHALDQGQRYTPLRYAQDPSDPQAIRVYAPKTPMAVPGHCMLVLVPDGGAPSEAVTIHLRPAQGEWKRTVIYVKYNQELRPGESLHLRGGHSMDFKHIYKGRHVPVAHANLVGALAKNKDESWMRWSTSIDLPEVCSEANHAQRSRHIFYTSYGYGTDFELPADLPYCLHKFEAYMRADKDAPDSFKDWFEFKVFVKYEGGKHYEGKRTEAYQVSGDTPPGQSNYHWAKVGAVTTVTFGEDDADMYDLNETPLLLSQLPYTPGNGLVDDLQGGVPLDELEDWELEDLGLSPGFGSLFYVGVATAMVGLVAAAAALVVFRRRQRASAVAEDEATSKAVQAATA